MRNLRLFGVLAGGISALLCAVLLGVWLFVNPNHYKGRIAAAVKESTGRELQLSGDIKLSVIPWVALELGPASLGSPPGFGEEPFLSFSHASIRVKLLPLLRQRLQVARVDIDGLDLRLRKNAQGRGNWQDAEPDAKPANGGRGSHARRCLGVARQYSPQKRSDQLCRNHHRAAQSRNRLACGRPAHPGESDIRCQSRVIG